MECKTLWCVLILAASSVLAAPLPEAWENVTDSNAAARAANDYADNTLRCTWAGDTRAKLPANAVFQFPVAGSEASVTNVQRILDETAAAIPSNLLAAVRHCRLLAPTLQWIVRSTLCKQADKRDYFWWNVHLDAFAEKDLNRTNLTAFARNLTVGKLPPATVIRFDSEENELRQTLAPAVPGKDYPGVRSEALFSTPFGYGMVVRAPESPRIFRFRASAFPSSRVPVSCKWVALSGGIRIDHWNWHRNQRLEQGFGRLVVDVGALFASRRLDVAVFTRWGKGPWGAPTIISFCASPCEIRTYDKNELRQIKYLPAPRNPFPYDLSAVFVPADWTDDYRTDDYKRIIGFTRLQPDNITREDFSVGHERIIESYPNEAPKVSEKIRYFIKDGQLRYEATGEKAVHRLSDPQSRRLAR